MVNLFRFSDSQIFRFKKYDHFRLQPKKVITFFDYNRKKVLFLLKIFL